MWDMKSIALYSKGRGPKKLHIEADGCIINIQVGLHDTEGRQVTYISVDAQGDRYAGEPEWWVTGKVQASREGVGIRVVEKPRRKRRSSRG